MRFPNLMAGDDASIDVVPVWYPIRDRKAAGLVVVPVCAAWQQLIFLFRLFLLHWNPRNDPERRHSKV